MIHPSSIIDPSAKIADSVEIGPFCLIGPNVEIEEGTKIESHVILKGPTKIGKNNHIFHHTLVEIIYSTSLSNDLDLFHPCK